MAHINASLVRETTTTTSTGTYTLAGAQTNFRTFLAAPMATGDTCWYTARLGPDYEIGLGTFTSPNLLARTTILESSNSNNAVSWGAGVKDIYMTTPPKAVMASHAATIASAGTTELGSSTAPVIDISGSVTITSFGSTAPPGTVKFVRLQGALQLTHNATSMILPGVANIAAAAGDTLIAKHEGSGNWRVLNYQRSNLPPPLAASVQVFTSGSGTYTTPAGALYLVVELIGGGGGGGGSGTAGGTGGTGGNSTFSTMAANGGTGGAGVGSAAGVGGTATGGDVNIGGGNGGAANSGTAQYGGFGGISFLGAAGIGGNNGGGTGGAAGTNSGSGGGGGGAGATSGPGCGGAAGGYCRKTISAPAATYSYAVGAGGAGGTLGTGGAGGGGGAAGIVIVTAHFR